MTPEYRHGSGMSVQQELARYAVQNEVTFDPALQLFARHLLNEDPLGGFYGRASSTARQQLVNLATGPDIHSDEGDYRLADVYNDYVERERAAGEDTQVMAAVGRDEAETGASSVFGASDSGRPRARFVSLRDNPHLKRAGIDVVGSPDDPATDSGDGAVRLSEEIAKRPHNRLDMSPKAVAERQAGRRKWAEHQVAMGNQDAASQL